MNHEIPDGLGVQRDHGSAGAFVSEWIINKNDLSVVSADDLSRTVYLWQDGDYVSGTTVWLRLCSADLPALTPSTTRVRARVTTAGSSWTARRADPKAARSAT